ncbi:hypothetical protein [Candidatus Accumulibacter vicinus]|uniref:Uncharacterized protein n=1 Tax=Candidatus Accumulibacter vicinus TaxID=2954382 RepID=A0A084Y3V9_9PROT|nr:hypothetical protein [Candidatus Accumulibacter vicinus]KFB69403.1 MAG: hypothetical protein CAPSK01_000877 [Candidatus Accumulibacter vicinus]
MTPLFARLRPKPGIGPALYCAWAIVAIGLSIVLSGLSPESVTRLFVIALLLGELAFLPMLVDALPALASRTRFLVLGTLLAAAVEGMHMLSMPVFLALRIDRETSFGEGLVRYALDLLFTLPAYLVIFSLLWFFINRYRYTLWNYILVMGLAQTLGDGGLFFFIDAPAMLFFLPYPMTNYHAINVIPFLAVRDHLPPARSAGAGRYLAIPALIGAYLVCGAIIRLVGRSLGFAAD